MQPTCVNVVREHWRRCSVQFIVALLLAVAICIGRTSAEPYFFWYHVYGVSDYGSRGEDPAANLNVAAMDTAFRHAVEANSQYLAPYIDVAHIPGVTNVYPNHVARRYGSAPFDTVDFAVLHAHGFAWSDTNGNDYDDRFDNGLAPFYLGAGSTYEVLYDSLYFGYGPWNWLKWVWAASCSWFDVGWGQGSDSIVPTGTSQVIDCSLGRGRLHSDTCWRRWDGTDCGGYRAHSGITVASTGLSGCGSDEWYKRNRWFVKYGGTEQPRIYKCNTVLLKAAAPGSSSQTQGRVAICCGRVQRGMGGPTDDAFEPDTANPICTFEIKGSSGQVAEYSYVINESGPTAYLGEYVPHVNPDAFWGCDLYLLFSNCSSDLTICDLWFFYDPLEEPGTLARMDSMPKSVGKMFGGVHAIMGWSNETYASYNRDRFGAFLSNWWQDTTHHTSTSFLSIGQDRNWDWALGDWRPFVAPAIAVAVGPSNDRYKYLFEKWHRLDDTRAPRDSAMIAWCIPYFDDPDYGYYWVE